MRLKGWKDSSQPMTLHLSFLGRKAIEKKRQRVQTGRLGSPRPSLPAFNRSCRQWGQRLCPARIPIPRVSMERFQKCRVRSGVSSVHVESGSPTGGWLRG